MENMIGAYGPWAASLAPDKPGPLSLRGCPAPEFAKRREAARQRILECMAPPSLALWEAPSTDWIREFDGLIIEALSWQLPAGSRTEAWLLKPADARGKLPGVLALHDHGGFKFLGKEKIAQAGPDTPPLVQAHRADAYDGLAWANELARRGYAVLVSDAFAFGSRRVYTTDLPMHIRGSVFDDSDDSLDGMNAYNAWSGTHEHIMAKSLFCAGTTWPGVFWAEDRIALDVLCARPEVDPERIGVGGLSGGGLRTGFLGGLDDRVRCAVCVGLMTTWRDFLLNKSHTHTWMCYVPLLPRDLDFPEIFGCRAPLPALVQNTRADPLFTVPEMQRALDILSEIYRSSGAPDHFRGSWYPGHHQFNQPMQEEAFAWFDQWLKPTQPVEAK